MKPQNTVASEDTTEATVFSPRGAEKPWQGAGKAWQGAEKPWQGPAKVWQGAGKAWQGAGVYQARHASAALSRPRILRITLPGGVRASTFDKGRFKNVPMGEVLLQVHQWWSFQSYAAVKFCVMILLQRKNLYICVL